MYTLQEWLQLENQDIAEVVAQKTATAVIYLNGTRRWFLSQNKNWDDYPETTGTAHRRVTQLFYDHGIQTLIQPILGYDLLERGQDYMRMAIGQGLAQLISSDYQDWYHREQIRVTFYGNWLKVLSNTDFIEVTSVLQLIAKTSRYRKRRLLLGVFADEGLDSIVAMAKQVHHGNELLRRYYGQPVGPVDLILGSGQPAIWDLPLLDLNKANLYFMQAPTFCLDEQTLRQVLYDHLYARINDDELYNNLSEKEWRRYDVLGIGHQTRKGWIAT